MAKLKFFTWPLIYLMFFPSKGQATLYLQMGDKCQEEKAHTFPLYDDPNQNSSFPGIESFSGSEIASTVCDPAIPLVCLAGRCQCKKGYTINRNGTKCLEVARNGLDSSCEENIQCWKSLLGRLSECNLSTRKCQCYESESLPIVYHHGRCYYGETLGEYCQIDGLCEATLPNASCRSGTCQCGDSFVPSWDKSRCIPIALGLNSTCEENIQCEKSQLGALSECNQETMKCNCYKLPDMDTVFHGGKCYFEAALGDVCQVSAQCQKKTLNSVCSRDGKCICSLEDGYIANGNNTRCLAIPSSDGAAVTTTVVLGSSNSGTDVTNGGYANPYNNSSGNEECLEDAQCFRILGPLSRCNLVKHKCECFIPENFPLRLPHSSSVHPTNENPAILTGAYYPKNSLKTEGINESEQVEMFDFTPSLVIVGNRCYLSKHLGHLCKFNKQCSSVTENSRCDNGRCECIYDTHVRSEDGRKCLKIAQKGLDSSCDEDAQCTRSELGPLSRCNLEKKRCECSNSVLPVVYYKGKCYFHRQLGSSCESNVECQAGSNYLAECNLGRCRCQTGTIRLSQHVCSFNRTTTTPNRASSKAHLMHFIISHVSIILILLFLTT